MAVLGGFARRSAVHATKDVKAKSQTILCVTYSYLRRPTIIGIIMFPYMGVLYNFVVDLCANDTTTPFHQSCDDPCIPHNLKKLEIVTEATEALKKNIVRCIFRINFKYTVLYTYTDRHVVVPSLSPTLN